MNNPAWKCVDCGAILGFLEEKCIEGYKKVRIKRKDLYITVEGGTTTVICYHCGKTNILNDKVKASPQEVDLQEKSIQEEVKQNGVQRTDN